MIASPGEKTAPPKGNADVLLIGTEPLLKLISHALGAYPKEACGTLLGDKGKIAAALPAMNDAADKEASFALSPAAILRAERAAEQMRLEVVGFYHSHPDCPALPSAEDVRHMPPGTVFAILPVRHGHPGSLRAYVRDAVDAQVREMAVCAG